MKVYRANLSKAVLVIFVGFVFAAAALMTSLIFNATLSKTALAASSLGVQEETSAGGTTYHVIQFGEYPQDYVGAVLNSQLEAAYNGGSLIGGMIATGRSYTSNSNVGSNASSAPGGSTPLDYGGYTAKENLEYEYNNVRYVREQSIITAQDYNTAIYVYNADGSVIPVAGSTVWFKVEPINWIILNWDNLPKYINPYGDATANSYTLLAQNSLIAGIPFYINSNAAGLMWQNSTIRGYLNGTNVLGGDFSNSSIANAGHNFLNEAFTQNGFDASAENVIPTVYPNTNTSNTTTINNSNKSAVEGGAAYDTTDQAAILSYYEAFSGYSLLQDVSLRLAVSSDYARSNNAPISPNGGGRDWTRSAASASSVTGIINTGASGQSRADYQLASVRPMISLNLQVALTFNPNGGMFDPSDSLSTAAKTILLADGDTFNSTDVATPINYGYDFAGWNTMADGSGTAYAAASDIPENISVSGTFYAMWTPINYKLNSQTSVEGQTINFYNDSSLPITDATINQAGYIQTYLFQATDENFISFMVLKNDGSLINPAAANPLDDLNWVNLSGSFAAGSNPLEYHLSLNGLIDANFIKSFACYNSVGGWSINIKAVYSTAAPIQITIDALSTAQRDYGSVMLDGAKVSYGSAANYMQGSTAPVTVTAIADKYRTFLGFDVRVNDGITTTVFAAGDYNVPGQYTVVNGNTIQVIPQDGMHISAEFGSADFGISVEAQCGDGEVVPLTTGAVIYTGVQQIALGGTYTNSVQSVEGYKLTGGAYNNSVKIYNQITHEFDTYAAISGVINFSNIDSSFFDNYLDNGAIVIYAVYVKQFQLAVSVDNSTLGGINVTVVDENGISSVVSEFPAYVDEGSTVTIGIAGINSGVQISSVTGINAGEQNENKITFIIGEDRTIGITFVQAVYNVNVQAVDENYDPITDIEITSSAHTVALGDTINIIKGDYEGYTFMGWYIIENGTPVAYDLANDDLSDLDITSGFINDWADGSNFNIVAKFGKTYSIQMFVSNGQYSYGADAGSQSALMSVAANAGEDANASITLVIVPNQYYTLSTQGGIDGLYGDETITPNGDGTFAVIISVDGPRILSINCTPITYSVTSSGNDLSGARGSIVIETLSAGVNDSVVISFNVSSGYQVSGWKLYNKDGVDITDLSAVKISGSTATIAVNPDILSSCLDTNGQLVINSTVTTTINNTYLTMIIVAAVGIPILLVAAVLLFIANKRKKQEYQEALQKQKQGAAMLGQTDLIKKLREDNEGKR